LAILLAHAFPNATIDAVDISPDALDVAKKNIAGYNLEHQVNLIRSDLFAELGERTYDLIISNPPYVSAAAMAALPEEYRHEPENALASGADGLEATRTILNDAANHLTEGGLLVVEIGHNRDTLEQAYPETAFTWLETSAGDEFVFLLKRDQLP
jgi:ribosomal protein L3 glutamine methyltransferase